MTGKSFVVVLFPRVPFFTLNSFSDKLILAQDFELYCRILPIQIYLTENKDKYLDQINFDT